MFWVVLILLSLVLKVLLVYWNFLLLWDSGFVVGLVIIVKFNVLKISWLLFEWLII